VDVTAINVHDAAEIERAVTAFALFLKRRSDLDCERLWRQSIAS
jgi:hypothetical protein